MKNHVIALISVLIINISCKKDFLEVVDKSVLLEEGYVVDLNTTGHYLNGVYAQFVQLAGNGINLAYPDIMSDNLKPTNYGQEFYGHMYYWKESVYANNGNYFSKGYWNSLYKVAKISNFVIEKANDYKSQNVNKANLLEGQALAIRAYVHFMLVNAFAQSYNYTADASHLGIPYVKTSDFREKVKRETVSENYKDIISDLDKARELLPSSFDNKEFMNYNAAQALLARVYLFKNEYSLAKNLAIQLLQRVPIMKNDFPAKLYTKDETEAIFHMAPNFSESDLYMPIFSGYYTDYYILATSDITDLYNSYPMDKRNAWVTKQPDGNIVTKFPKGATGLFIIPEGDHYQTFFRSTEMALTAAECYAQLNNIDSARILIDDIRTRAGIPELESNISNVALMDTIRIERRKEMSFDGLRMFDLLRWKKGVVRQDALDAAAQNLPYPNPKSILPIPLEDVQLTGLIQNDGY